MDFPERIINRNSYLNAAIAICILEIDGKENLVFEKRAKHIRQGSEISFPGGKQEESDKDSSETAVRESSEELGLSRDKIEIIDKFGTFVTEIGILLDVFICKLNIEKIDEMLYNEDEVEKLVIVPLEFFLKEEYSTEIVQNKSLAKFEISKYNLPERYNGEWPTSKRKLYFYSFGGETIWGLTADVVRSFAKQIKEDGRVGKYEYKSRISN